MQYKDLPKWYPWLFPERSCDWYFTAAGALRNKLKEEGEFDNWRKVFSKGTLPPFFHFGAGMWVRNFLRTGAKLGPIEGVEGNFDDHYLYIVYLALGLPIPEKYPEFGKWEYHEKDEESQVPPQPRRTRSSPKRSK